MLYASSSLNRLLGELKKLPGVGEKTALRLAFHLLKSPGQVMALADSLHEVHGRIRSCSICHGITEEDPCCICTGTRDPSTICVVEEPQDLLAIERSHAFRGHYHVLQGALSPLNGVTPAQLKIPELLARLEESRVAEVIIATSFTVEGEATALYLAKVIKPLGKKITRLAHGIPLGSDLEYVDATTMQRAVQGRAEL
ncbi:recombination mediator RecR [Geobacter sp. DSM 9736]|uniref:recombination mediator RecR n=1 Tax=Geobacter sp. DSM 9736 TaxID=1277350 RepID=UPI000B50CCF8|nr:recombination mediator RecR [Geobacter sp. DSM 9736]SNB47402.1 DNA replication and repair protein RecR [Geobacter sp. DSM 9736]